MSTFDNQPNLAPPGDGRRTLRGAGDPARLLEECAAENWAGARTQMLKDDLWLYGWDTVRGLIATRKIASIPTGIPSASLSDGLWAVLESSKDECAELTISVLARAVPRFLESLQNGAYDSEREASIATFFTGRCGLAFKDVSREWASSMTRRMRELGSFDWAEVWAQVEAKSAWSNLWEQDTVTSRLMVRSAVARIMADLNPQERVILAMVLQGSPRQEIADELRLSLKAIEGRLTRLRKAVQPRVSQYLAVDDQGASS